MKRANGLLAHIAEPGNLRLAAWKAGKGKRYARSVLAYQANLETNILQLRTQIMSGAVEVGDYRYFKVYEPKERQICASAFREQVLHHALMNVCHEFFERIQIFDSYASRKGKGVHAALGRAGEFSRQYGWFLKLDVRKFFDSVHHDVIRQQLSRLFKEQRLLEIFDAILNSYAASPSRGLPIGNLTSQYFANHYLAELDHFVKEKLCIKAYVRYMDDMVLWHHDKAALQVALREIRAWLDSRLRCELKPPQLNRCHLGLPFLGYRIFPYHLRLLQTSKVRFIRKMRRVEERYHSGAWSEETCSRRAWPLVAFTEHADAEVFRKNVLLKSKGQAPEGL